MNQPKRLISSPVITMVGQGASGISSSRREAFLAMESSFKAISKRDCPRASKGIKTAKRTTRSLIFDLAFKDYLP